MKSKYIYPETHVVETLICSPCMLDPVSGGEPIVPPGHPGTGAPIRRIGGLGTLGKVGSVK